MGRVLSSLQEFRCMYNFDMSQKEIVGVLFLTGPVCSYAYLNSKETISQVLDEIKEDIIMGLRNRLDIMCDEADGETGMIADGATETNNDISIGEPTSQPILQPLRKQCTLPLPRRVFIPWLAGTFICDYLKPSETLEVLKDHVVEPLSMEAPADVNTIIVPEAAPPTLTSGSFFVYGNWSRISIE
ncbi:hypothetical protein Ancab_016702 [Ancistrocladus abbreviatus]